MYTFSKFPFLKILKFPKFWALHFGAPGAISPFFNSFVAWGLTTNFQYSCFDFLSYFLLHGGTNGLTTGPKSMVGYIRFVTTSVGFWGCMYTHTRTHTHIFSDAQT